MYYPFLKRMIDVALSTFILFALLPIIFVIIILLCISNRGRPFFVQIRPGKNGRLFSIFKFKTMNDRTTDKGELLPDAKRLTVIGKVLRKTSLDEIPQLINVLKGDMSLIGPRPLLPSYLPLYNAFQKRRHEVKPGITGWAQVNGRNAISWDKKFEMDVWYVDHVSLLLDLKILWMTFLKVLNREGISSPTSATMEYFTGNT